jgi:hypothetical protein
VKRPLRDDALADALVVGREGGGCPPQDRFLVAASGELPPAQFRALLDHAAGCPDGSLALRTAREVHGAFSPARPTTGMPTLGQRLAATVLAPRPALAYLILLALLIPLALRDRVTPERAPVPVPVPGVAPPPDVPPLMAPRVLQLTGDPALRGDRPAPAPPSLGTGPVLLRLYVDPEEATPPLRVRVGDLSLDAVGEEGGTVDVLVSPQALPGDGPWLLEILSGTRVVFRQTLAR